MVTLLHFNAHVREYLREAAHQELNYNCVDVEVKNSNGINVRNKSRVKTKRYF